MCKATVNQIIFDESENNMDTEKCRAILCAIDMGSLSAAAEALGYTPSGISRMLRSLEEEAGFLLLTRGRSGVEPTNECIRLLPVLRKLADRGEEFRQTAAELRGCEIGSITVGTAYPVFYRWLGGTIAAFKNRYPAIQVGIMDGTSSELCRAVTEHRMDFCIVSRRAGDFQWIPIGTDPLVAWVSSESVYAELEKFPMHAFAKEPYVATNPKQETDNSLTFKKLGITPNIRYTASDSYATYAMVEAGIGVSMNNALTARKWTGHVKVVPVEPEQKIEIGIAALGSGEISPAAQRFLEFARKRLSRMEQEV